MGEADGELNGQVKTGWERGQTLVLAAFLLIIMVGMLAIVIDLGNAYTQRRAMQNAADAAALAGVRELALEHTGVVTTAVEKFATQYNSAQTFGSEIISKSVMVTAGKTFSTYFGGVIGWPSFSASAVAEAKYSAACNPVGAMPIAASEAVLSATGEVAFWSSKNADGTDEEPPANLPDCPGCAIISGGNRGWLTLGGHSADTLGDLINAGGYEGTIALTDTHNSVNGVWIAGKTGVNTSVLQAAQAQWSDKNPDVKIIVPIFKWFDQGLNGGSYFVTGFAVMAVTKVRDSGNPKYVAGYFVPDIVPGAEPDCPTDYGARVINLVQ